MKNLLFCILIGMLTFQISAQEKIETTNIDPLIETNLTDNLKTKVRFRKSRNIDINRLTRLSRITDLHKRRRLRMSKNMELSDMTVSEVLEAKKLSYNDQSFMLTKYGVLNPLVSTNIYISKLSPFSVNKSSNSLLNLIQLYDLNVQSLTDSNIKLSESSRYLLSSIKCVEFDVSSLYLNDLDVQFIQTADMSATDTTIDNSVYIIDNSKFDIIITEKHLKELSDATFAYRFERDNDFNEAYLKDLKNLDKEDYFKWIQLMYEHSSLNIEFIKSKKTYKIISEARIENGWYDDYVKSRMFQNISVLKKNGYDTVLVRFNCEQELSQIVELINDIKSTGMRVYSVYVGLDNQKPTAWNPFVKPEILENYISQIAPISDGWLLNWRCTSQHVKLLPKKFWNYMCATIRKYNSQCLIYGEIYYGQIDPLRIKALMYNIPENISGVVINNMGYYGYNHQFIVNRFFTKNVPNYRKLDKLAQVIGYRPYYASKDNLYLDIHKEYQYKKAIEKNFSRVRCGTVTLLHDGVDDNYVDDGTYQTQDNILYDVKIQSLSNQK